jgi:hypothetical protein
MAKAPGKRTQKAKKMSFYEVVLEGSPKTACGFLAGLLLGSEREGTVFFCQDEGISFESFTDKLAELVRLHPRDCHIIVDAETRNYLTKLAPRIEKETGLRITSCRHIRSASMGFHFEAYGRRYAQEILGKLHSLPAGLRLVDFTSKEDTHPEAAGIEAYTPAHDYEFTGEGRIVGRIDLLIMARRDLDRQPLLQLDRIELNLA